MMAANLRIEHCIHVHAQRAQQAFALQAPYVHSCRATCTKCTRNIALHSYVHSYNACVECALCTGSVLIAHAQSTLHTYNAPNTIADSCIKYIEYRWSECECIMCALGVGLQGLYSATNCADNILGRFTMILQNQIARVDSFPNLTKRWILKFCLNASILSYNLFSFGKQFHARDP